MPPDYMFPSYVVYVLWGPFAPASEQLDLLRTDNKTKTKGDGSQVKIREEEKNNKAND